MLVPDEIVTGMVQEDLQIFFSNALGLGLILDGYPRTIVQAQSLEIFLKKFKKKIDKAIFINLPHQVIIDRLSGRRICKACGTVFHVRTGTKVFGKCDKCNDDLVQRSDDKEDVIKSRLDIYYKSANTLSEFYKELGLYCEIDGLGSPVEVFNRLCTAIEK
jgi:adenylate kinase